MPDAATAPRLQKLLAERGMASRRGAAELIRAGRVGVDGVICREPGARVDPAGSVITVAGRPLAAAPETPRTILLNKPRGFVCARAARSGRSVYELLKGVPEHVVPAGRLDLDSEGLLVLSNDGALIHRLTHPRFGHRKTYRVTVSGPVDSRTLAVLNRSMLLDGYRTRPAAVRVLRQGEKAGRTLLEFVLREGRNRQVRNMCDRVNLRVHRLVRTQSGPFSLVGLKPGQWRDAPA